MCELYRYIITAVIHDDSLDLKFTVFSPVSVSCVFCTCSISVHTHCTHTLYTFCLFTSSCLTAVYNDDVYTEINMRHNEGTVLRMRLGNGYKCVSLIQVMVINWQRV